MHTGPQTSQPMRWFDTVQVMDGWIDVSANADGIDFRMRQNKCPKSWKEISFEYTLFENVLVYLYLVCICT
jgi:hypothetical protein